MLLSAARCLVHVNSSSIHPRMAKAYPVILQSFGLEHLSLSLNEHSLAQHSSSTRTNTKRNKTFHPQTLVLDRYTDKTRGGGLGCTSTYTCITYHDLCFRQGVDQRRTLA